MEKNGLGFERGLPPEYKNNYYFVGLTPRFSRGRPQCLEHFEDKLPFKKYPTLERGRLFGIKFILITGKKVKRGFFLNLGPRGSGHFLLI